MDFFLDLAGANGLTLDLGGTHELSIERDIGCIKVVEVKVNTTAYWNSMISYIPKRGELFVYLDHETSLEGDNIPAIKVGDGSAYLIDLPFISTVPIGFIEQLTEHIRDGSIHVTEEEKDRWNSKLNCDINGETLILNKL